MSPPKEKSSFKEARYFGNILFEWGDVIIRRVPFWNLNISFYDARTDRRFKLAMLIFTAMAAEVGSPRTMGRALTIKWN